MPTGTVKWYNPTKRFGFLEPEEGDKDIFVHVTAVEAAGLSTLHEGQKIQYEWATGEDGRSSATDLSLVEG